MGTNKKNNKTKEEGVTEQDTSDLSQSESPKKTEAIQPTEDSRLTEKLTSIEREFDGFEHPSREVAMAKGIVLESLKRAIKHNTVMWKAVEDWAK